MPPHSYASYLRAEVLEARGEPERASALYRVALEEFGPDPWLQSRLAQALLAAGQSEEARAVIDEGLARGPYWALYLQRGRLAEAAGDAEAAIAAYQQAMSQEPGNQAASALANLLRRRKQPERALEVLKTAAKTAPRYGPAAATAALELALAERDPERIERALSTLRGLRVPPRHKLIEVARVELTAGRPVMAARLLDLLPTGPDSAALHVRALLESARWNDAAALLITLEPADLGGPIPTANALLAAGEPAQALALAREALVTTEAEQPTAVAALTRERAWLVVARASLALGQPAKATAALDGLPAGSALAAEGRELRLEALRAAGMPDLAAELRSLPPRERGEAPLGR